MGQAKQRGTYEERVAQAKAREEAKLAEAREKEQAQVNALVKRGMEPFEALRAVRGVPSRRGALLIAALAGLTNR